MRSREPSASTSSLLLSATGLAAYSCSHVLHCHPRPANTPARAHAARWWPQMSSGWPHLQLRTVRWRKVEAEDNHPEFLRGECCQSVHEAKPAPGPPWDLINAFLASPILGKRLVSRKDSSTRDAASCYPSLKLPGSKSSGARGSGLTPIAKMGARTLPLR